MSYPCWGCQAVEVKVHGTKCASCKAAHVTVEPEPIGPSDFDEVIARTLRLVDIQSRRLEQEMEKDGAFSARINNEMAKLTRAAAALYKEIRARENDLNKKVDDMTLAEKKALLLTFVEGLPLSEQVEVLKAVQKMMNKDYRAKKEKEAGH